MLRRVTRIRQQIATAALAAALGVLPGVGSADDEWNDEGAADASAEQVDDHEAGSEDPDGRMGASEDSDAMEAGSEDPEQRMAGDEDSDSMVTGSEDIDRHESESEDLTNLPAARTDPGESPIEAPGQAGSAPTTDPEVVIARDALLRAESRATAASTAYGDMIQRNYPRGDARIRIVRERDEAMKALDEAKRSLAAAER